MVTESPIPGRYIERGADRFNPRSGGLRSFVSVVWPIAGLAAVVAYILTIGWDRNQLPDWLSIAIVIAGWILVIKVPLNIHEQVRRLLRASLPLLIRSRRGVIMLRWFGTLVCAVGGAALVAWYALLTFVYGLSRMNPS